MGLQEQVIKMMIDSKSPEEMGQIVSEMFPQIMQRLGSQNMTKILVDILPRMVEKMNGSQVEDFMIKILPGMMNTSCAVMDKEQRKFILKHMRDMIDKMEQKYPA